MNKITLPKASFLTSPNPVTLVCTKKEDGKTNLATVSWWTYLSYNPSMIAFAMAKPSYTGEMVRKNKELVLTIPGKGLEDIVMSCGGTTGRNIDKVYKFAIDLENLENTSIQIPKHSKVAIVCSLKEFHEVGDHYLYICNVSEVYGNESEEALFSWKGYSEIHAIK